MPSLETSTSSTQRTELSTIDAGDCLAALYPKQRVEVGEEGERRNLHRSLDASLPGLVQSGPAMFFPSC
ncbi:hypothetical protein GOP47_0011090 [Adiantum capillus-veneris]|uniref:Uncharacterized protein n=1 Tax=Adiantum capillus-veneris TaxID=13818 RepID=A0A9D4UT82_ADICA|nr:hypothetical protein GOP47_0011090 [Adiantum capillus-veneris]